MKTTKHNINYRLAALCFSWSLAILLMQLTASAQTLVNRYSFNDDGTDTNIVDSVGGTNWYGLLPNGGDLVDVPGQLILSSSSDQYVQLPAGILSNYTAVTIDCWASYGTLPNNCFLYGFGNTDSGGAGEDYIFCQPAGGRIAITGVDPGYVGEQGTGGAGNFSGQTVHVTSVYNSPAGYLEMYTNGVLVSRNTAVTVPMSSVNDVLNYIGRSLYNGDSYMDVELDEFRIWNGALNGLQVAGCDVSGPDNTNYNAYGTVTSVSLQIPFYQLVQGTHETATVSAQTSALSYPVDITLLATYKSSNTNILQLTNNVIYAVGQGSANIVATYGSLSSTQTITVIQPASVLTHRYSFTADASDSIGGAAWNGTLPNGGTFAGSQLSLLAASSQYVQLPAGIISNYNAVTIEAWATFPDALPANCFFFGFGNTDGGGAGANYIYMQPRAGHIGIGGNDPGYSGEQQAGTYGNLSTHTNIHIAAVFNPAASTIAVYTNGILAGKNIATTWQLNNVSSVLNYIARSLYNGDSYMDVNVDEFRIYSGALTSQGIAISDGAGPNSIPAGVTNGPGALLSLTIQAPATLQPSQPGTVKLLANYEALTNWDIIGNSVVPPAGLTIATSDTNVLVYGADNLIHAINPGTAYVITVYEGLTNTATVTVVQAPQATLVHEYSFSDTVGSTTAADSVGGAAWNGTLPNGGVFNGTGQLGLTNTSSQYVSLPSGILSNYTTVTIEEWVTLQSNPGYTMYWSFGNTDAGGLGANYLFADYGRTYTCISAADPGYNGEQGTAGGAALPVNTVLHVATVCNPSQGYIALYTNGVLQSLNNGITDPMSVVSATYAYIGKSLYNDPYASETIDEFRIYNGVLSPNDLKATQALGPNQVLVSSVGLSAKASGGNLVLSWPLTGGGYALQGSASLTSGNWTTISTPAAQIVGSQWQVTIPVSSGVKFFRLAR